MDSKQLRNWRHSLKLSQSQLARRLSVAPTTVARWERSEREIPPFLHLAMAWIDQEVKNTHGQKDQLADAWRKESERKASSAAGSPE